jgi:hypothetical protein
VGCDSRWRTLPREERITEGKSASPSRPFAGGGWSFRGRVAPWLTGLRGWLFAGGGWSLRGLVGTLANRAEWMRTLRIRGCRLSALPLHMARTDPCHIEAPAPGENPGHAVRRHEALVGTIQSARHITAAVCPR